MNRFIILFLLLIPGMSRSQNLSFDGTNDYVSTANTSDLSGNSTASIQVWIYKTSDPASGVILYHGSGAADGTDFALHENYPNPFNPTTTLRFDLPELSDMTLIIYNMLGQKVKTFNMQSTPAGYHSVTWDATNDLGQQVGAGVYLYQLQTKDFVKTRKMVLLK